MKSKLQNKIKQAKRFIIVGPMSFSKKQMEAEIKKLDRNELFILYVDGGVKYRTFVENLLEKESFLTFSSMSVGDNDSSKVKLDHLKIDQEMSDLAYVLMLIKKFGTQIESVFLYGFLGKSPRYDHLLVNMGEISSFQKAILPARPLLSMEGKIIFCNKGHHILSIKSLFSLLTLIPIKVEISGECEFHFAGILNVLSSQGLSNLGHGLVSIEASGPFIVTMNRK
jgi:thiamine pyrophosphokinase